MEENQKTWENWWNSFEKEDLIREQGNIIGELDMQIAAIALANDLILVTNNTKEFERVKSLKLENWTE